MRNVFCWAAIPHSISIHQYHRALHANTTQTSMVDWARHVLGVKAGATDAELKDAYRASAVKSHPDRHPPDKKTEATRKFRRCSEAYAILKQSNDRASRATQDEASQRRGEGSNSRGRQGSATWRQEDAESLFRATFGGLTDEAVLEAALKRQVGIDASLGMLSLRRIRRQLSSSLELSSADPAFFERWPWRP